MIKAIPLEKKYLEQTSRLANAIFSHDRYIPSHSFEASLDKDKFKNFLVFKEPVTHLEYFIAIDQKENVLGTSGLFSMGSDDKDSDWLGWFCVDEKFRGAGIGKFLLEHTINKARMRGKKFLKLYTSTHPVETKAQKLYDLNGFFITDQERIIEDGYETFFRMKEL